MEYIVNQSQENFKIIMFEFDNRNWEICFELNKTLKKYGANIEVIDPLFSNEEIEDLGLNSYSGKNTEVDGIIIHTNHMEFTSILKTPFPNCKAIIDGRNFLKDIQEINSIPIVRIGGGSN